MVCFSTRWQIFKNEYFFQQKVALCFSSVHLRLVEGFWGEDQGSLDVIGVANDNFIQMKIRDNGNIYSTNK